MVQGIDVSGHIDQRSVPKRGTAWGSPSGSSWFAARFAEPCAAGSVGASYQVGEGVRKQIHAPPGRWPRNPLRSFRPSPWSSSRLSGASAQPAGAIWAVFVKPAGALRAVIVELLSANWALAEVPGGATWVDFELCSVLSTLAVEPAGVQTQGRLDVRSPAVHLPLAGGTTCRWGLAA